MKIKIENCNYEIIKDYKNYDYIKIDNNKENPNFNSINDYAKVEEYRKTNCAYGCKYFILKKIAKNS